MLIAMVHGQSVLANRNLQRVRFICPVCKQPVILRAGQIKVAHFAHIKGGDCAASEGETSEHLLGKKQLYAWAVKRHFSPRYEVYLSAIKQRPDLLIKIGARTVALEYQCSPISLARLQERNRGYQKLNIIVWWILGAPYQQRRLSNVKIAQFTQKIAGRLGLLFWSTTTKKFMYGGHYQLIDFCKTNRPHMTSREIVIQQTKTIDRQLMQGHERLEKIVQHCYQAGHLFSGIPIVAHYSKQHWPAAIYGLTIWQTQVLLQLEQEPINRQWSLEDWFEWLKQDNSQEWLSFPCLPTDYVKIHYFKQFTLQLKRYHIISLNRNVTYVNAPEWFNDGTKKMNYLKNNSEWQ